MTTNNLTNIEIDEISILSKDVRPAVRAARIAIKKEAHMSEPISFATFEEAVAHLRKVHGMSGLDAMSAAARRHPDLVQKYNDAGRVDETPVRRVPTIPADVVRFDSAVADIMRRDGCDKLTAMERARAEQPALFAAYQAAGAAGRASDLRPPGAFAV